jgi:hypothetical protein
MKRIIFVGMNNKPGVSPLCSSTKSGKLIDSVIWELRAQTIGLGDDRIIKSNLFDLDHFPETTGFNYEWCDRVGYRCDDIIVTLGASVHENFKKSPYKVVALGHPSAVWSNRKKFDYVDNAVRLISERISLPKNRN